MKVWIVMDSDGDSSWPVAAYFSEEMANTHAEEMRLWISEQDILETLPDEVTNPQKQAERKAESVRRTEEFKRRQEYEQRQHRAAMELRPEGKHLRLCHCATFSTDGYFINPFGYCRFCGGFTPPVFRRHMGESELIAAISDLAKHERVKMREICALPKE